MAEKTPIPMRERQMLNGHYCTWWAREGLLQTMTARYNHKGVSGYVFDLAEEWNPVQDKVRRIEVVKKRTTRVEATISGDDARKYGRPIRTQRGWRWWIPVWRWDR